MAYEMHISDSSSDVCSSDLMRHIERKLSVYEVLTEEGLELIEHNADTVLEEIGIEFREDPETLSLWKEAGADVRGSRVRFPRGLVRSLVATAPSVFTQHARTPERSAVVGGKAPVLSSEESRGGQGRVSACRSRVWTDQ